jgi:hypothetical protein
MGFWASKVKERFCQAGMRVAEIGERIGGLEPLDNHNQSPRNSRWV